MYSKLMLIALYVSLQSHVKLLRIITVVFNLNIQQLYFFFQILLGRFTTQMSSTSSNSDLLSRILTQFLRCRPNNSHASITRNTRSEISRWSRYRLWSVRSQSRSSTTIVGAVDSDGMTVTRL